MQHHHRHVFRINFHRETMIGANFARRRILIISMADTPFLKADDLEVVAKFSLTSYFLFRCKLISSLPSTFILYFQISGQSFPMIGILRYISRFVLLTKQRISSKGDDKAYPQVLSCFPI